MQKNWPPNDVGESKKETADYTDYAEKKKMKN